MVCNTTVTEATGLPPVCNIINTRRSALFGLTVRLAKQTSAHRALKLTVDARCSCPPSLSWRQPHGLAQTIDAFEYIHPTAVGQCCAAWSWSYCATSLARLTIIMMMKKLKGEGSEGV